MFYKIKVVVVCICFLFGLCGCRSDSKESISYQEGQSQYKIVLLGKESYVYSDIGLINGIDMAIEELKGTVDITWEHYDDNGDYEKGLLYGEQLAKDNSVLAVFTFQDFEVVEALASRFHEEKKPLISVQGCYESTLQKGYDYFFSAFTSAEDMGVAMGQYCKLKGVSNVACSHSDTTFELDEMRGFQREANKNSVRVADMIQGPNTMTELQNVYYTWKQLGVDAIYLAHYTYSNTEWMLQMIDYIRSKDPNILIMSDYSLNNEETLEAYGDALEGVVIPAPYSIQENEKMGEFREKYESSIKSTFKKLHLREND